MAEHEEGFVLTTVDSIMNSLRRTVGAKTVDIAAPVVNWARKSALWPMTFGLFLLFSFFFFLFISVCPSFLRLVFFYFTLLLCSLLVSS